MSDELQRILDAERAAPAQPPVGSASAGWQRLQRSIIAAAPLSVDVPPPVVETLAAAKTGAGLGLVGKVLATAAIVGASTTAVIVARPDHEPAPTLERAVHEERPVAEAPRPVASTTPPAATPQPVVVESEPPLGDPRSLLSGSVPRPSSTSAKRNPPKTSPAPAPPSDETRLEKERELVAASQRALADGRPTRALDVLDVHARTFPHGTMAEDRDALRVVALCAAGRTADAARERTKFFRRWPKSLHASRVRAACPD
jgi:hypothetical protein